MDKYQKRTDYYVDYEIVEPGVYVHNFLENADYVTDRDHCVILTGTVGEQWTISLDALQNKYVVDDDALGVGCQGHVHPRADGNVVHVEVATETMEVVTKYGARLTAHPGDIIAYADNNGQPNMENRRVINKEVFENTYERI